MIRLFLFLLFGVLDITLAVRFGPAELGQVGGLSHMVFPAALLFILRLFFLASSFIGCRSVSCEEMGFDYFIHSVSIPVCIMLLSFGFISQLARVFDMPGMYCPLIYAAMVLECGRLICSIWIHRTSKAVAVSIG